MFSTLLEGAGLGTLTGGIWVLAGTGAGLIAAGVSLLLVGIAADGVKLRKPKAR